MRTVGIFVFDEVEVLDFAGPFEVFSVAREPDHDSDADDRLFRPVTIAPTSQVITAVGGLLVQPHYTITGHPALDIMVIPGGRGARLVQRHNPAVIEWLTAQRGQVSLITSVCTGSFILAEGKLLDGHRATTHWGSLDRLQDDYPQVRVQRDQRVVDEGNVITSAGVSAGIDMSLHVVARLHGEATAAWTARRMEFDYWPEHDPFAS